jgi:hypothetical protein
MAADAASTSPLRVLRRIRIALPALSIPLLPLLVTVSITTTAFTLIGLSFGARLGFRYERNANAMQEQFLRSWAVLFAVERVAY